MIAKTVESNLLLPIPTTVYIILKSPSFNSGLTLVNTLAVIRMRSDSVLLDQIMGVKLKCISHYESQRIHKYGNT
jgi:hypothetical protein